jgi:hypothetical protein
MPRRYDSVLALDVGSLACHSRTKAALGVVRDMTVESSSSESQATTEESLESYWIFSVLQEASAMSGMLSCCVQAKENR